eukprot:CAMPEP_0167745524 /NCGR_PEP_ID=MMETSP0110_2-20121227/3198_1 /TAXON_ID=629695 /ORGANISM="Gymnochlora sp., Strain CCMP2014" /LENGTH=445 /DNA_ID=CAMNT_0007630173 /DNA_START=32 /DNA_END=1369 /DNA_ORIENTATION=-
MAQLVWSGPPKHRFDEEGKDRAPAQYTLDDKAVTVIGRGKTSSLRIRQKLCSRRHAEIMYRGKSWYVQDVSTNGTYVNGYRIKKVSLSDNDLIAFGAIGPLCGIGEIQQNYKNCDTLYQFKLVVKKVRRGQGKRCEMCKKIHDGLWGSGRFCKQSCAAQYSRKRGSQSSTAVPRKRAKGNDSKPKLPAHKNEGSTSRRRQSQKRNRRGPSVTSRSSRTNQTSSSRRRRRTEDIKETKKKPEVRKEEKIEYPPPVVFRDRQIYRPSLMLLQEDSRLYRVEAENGVRCYEAKDPIRYKRPEIYIKHGEHFIGDEVSGPWVRLGRWWLPIELNGKVLVKEDKKELKRRLGVHKNFKKVSKSKKVKKSKQTIEKKTVEKKGSSSERGKGEDPKSKADGKGRSIRPCENCGKKSDWGRFCGRWCAAKAAATSTNKKSANRKKVADNFYKG